MEAISTNTVNIYLNFYLQFWMATPPLSKPIWLIPLSLSSASLFSRTLKLGIKTPAMFYSDLSSLIEAFLTASTTLPLKISILVLKLSCCIFSFSNQEEGLFTLLTHISLTLKQSLHDLFKLFLKRISFSLEQLMTLLGSSNLLLI